MTETTNTEQISKGLPTSLADLVTFDWEAGKDVQVTCPECKGSFMHNEHLARVFPNTHWDDCCDAVMAMRVQEEMADKLDLSEKIRATIPLLYQDTDLERLPYPQRQEVLSWENKPKAQGLWILGDTRTGKTRTLCLLLEQLMDQGHEVQAFFHGAFNDDLLEVLRSERSFKAWKRKICRVPVLALDDLFSNKQTERSETALFEVLDERVSNYKATLVTTHVTGKDARSIFHSEKRGEAFFARVREFFKVIPFTKDTQGGLKI